MPDLEPTDLRSAAQQLVERPLADPTPVAELQARATRIVQRRRRAGATLTVVALLLLVAGITTVVTHTGSTRGVASVAGAPTTTTTAGASASATTVAGSTASAAPSAGSATATTVVSGSTATTAKKTSATTARKSAAVAPSTNKAVSGGVQNVSGGITNVVASPTQAPANVQAGGAVTMLQALDAASFDPVALTGSVVSDGVAPAAVFDLLVYTDPATGSIVPQTADSLTSTDGVTWTLKLRQGVKFTDGSVYDAAAVKFNWERLQGDSRAIRGPVANQIQSMNAVDAATLRITLRSKNVLFPASVALIPYVASPTALQAKGSGFAADPVGAGPFVLKSWDRNAQMTLLRSATYWNAPRPYLDQLVLKPVADEAQRINALANGQANVVSIASPQNADQAGRTPNTSGYPVLLNGGIAVWFNTKKAPFNDVRARRAVAMAIDPKDYAKVVDGGAVPPIDSAFRPESPFYDSGVLQPAYDPAGAQQLFDQLAAERGSSLTFSMTAATLPAQQAAAQYIQSSLNKYANVKMSVQTEALPQHTAACTSGSFDGACVMANAFTDPEPAWTGLYTCATPSPTGWCNSQFDRDVADNQQTSDPKQRIADIKDAQKQLVTEVPAFYVERGYSWIFAASTVRDVAFAGDGIPLFDRLWISGRTGTTTTTTAPSTTTTTARPTTTVAPTTVTTPPTTAKPATTTTAAKPVTTTAAKAGTTTSSTAVTSTTAAPIPTIEPLPSTTAPTNPDVALSPTAASQTKRLSGGMLALLVLLAVVFGVTSCAAFFLWRQQRAGTWWE
jgi:peptide/nickel transport system substrate-binding protein